MDTQTVTTMSELSANDYVTFISAATISETSGTPLTGGTNGSAVTSADYTAFLGKIESYSFNTLGCPSTDASIIALFVAFTKRMRDNVGVKFQTVVYRTAADYEGVINLYNTVKADGSDDASLVYWVTGISAGCAVNKSNTNKAYDGEFRVNVSLTQSELESGIEDGKFMLHKVGDNVRVLTDINSFVSTTDEKGSDFSANQTIRVLDQIANDIAVLFNTKYLGSVLNDTDGRLSFWNDVVKHHKDLESIRAIENFSSKDVTVAQGDNKKSIVVTDKVTVVNAMEQLYMTVTVE